MPTWKLELEYEGTRYRGWQIQHNAKSIQGEMQDAARQLFESKVEIYGAGRTDAGVHALGQVAHFDLGRSYDTDTVRDAINAHLRPHPVAVLKAEQDKWARLVTERKLSLE